MENFIFGLIAPFLDPKKGLDDAPEVHVGNRNLESYCDAHVAWTVIR